MAIDYKALHERNWIQRIDDTRSDDLIRVVVQPLQGSEVVYLIARKSPALVRDTSSEDDLRLTAKLGHTKRED